MGPGKHPGGPGSRGGESRGGGAFIGAFIWALAGGNRQDTVGALGKLGTGLDGLDHFGGLGLCGWALAAWCWGGLGPVGL